jgi:hypothetical protein
MRPKKLVPFLLGSPSCSQKQEKINAFQYFIDVDNNKDYRYYYNNLSDDYITIIKKQYKTNDTNVVFDSIVTRKINLVNGLKSQKFNITNTITDSIGTSNKDIIIVKYKTNFVNENNKSESYVERVLLQVSFNRIKKFIPYNPELNPTIDSLIKTKFTPFIFDELQKSLSPFHYKSDDVVFKKIEKQIELFGERIKKNDTAFLRHIYPPLIKSYLNDNNLNELSSENKLKMLNIIRNQFESRNVNFENLIIKNFIKIECTLKQNIYVVQYVVQMNGTLFLRGKMIVLIENNNVYFF